MERRNDGRYKQRDRRRAANQKRRSSMQVNYGVYPGSGPRQIEPRKKSRMNVVMILIAVLILGLLIVAGVYGYQKLNAEQEIEIIEMELSNPTLPQIAFQEAGYEVNTLQGYTQEMDILTMRDTICPLTPQGYLEVVLKPYENEITQISYQVFSIDGTIVLKEETITEWDDNEVKLNISNVLPDAQESLIEIELTMEDGSVAYYYTRLITYGSCNLSTNMSFVEMFHETILSQSSSIQSTEEVEYETEDSIETTENTITDSSDIVISDYLTSTTSTSGSSLQYVTMASSESDVTWGNLSPTVIGDVSINITECSNLFISVLLEYQVEATDPDTGNVDTYNVEEFLRVGYSSSTQSVQLKQYARTINQVLEVEQLVIDESSIDLGITSSDLIYKINETETAVAFVQERTLYLYNGNVNEVVEVFTLEENGEDDSRYTNRDYDINILSIDDNGSISFVAYGYMNRGSNEGQVGTAVYYYDSMLNTVVEKAFVSITTSFAVGASDMSRGMYYSSTQDMIYLIAQGSFYKVSLVEGIQEKLAEEINEDSYVISEDGKFIAYVIEESCMILEFETGDTSEIIAAEGSLINPLGFLEHDLIYGVYRDSDNLLDETGSEITPMYKIEICSEEGTLLKTYESDNQYIRDISILDNMITMNLVEVENEEYAYIGQDVITNNEVTASANISIKSYTTEEKLVQQLLSFTLTLEEAIDVNEIAVVIPQMAYSEETIRISYESESAEEMYYAYAYGQLQIQSTMASDAIKYASENIGAVVNEDMEYVWRSGSRDLTYTVSDYSSYASRISGGESAIEIVAESASGNVVFYTGCTTEQMCYIINQEQVIAAKLEDDSWILLIGYTGSTMYYLNQNGVKTSISMDKLDSQVIELIGDGRF